MGCSRQTEWSLCLMKLTEWQQNQSVDFCFERDIFILKENFRRYFVCYKILVSKKEPCMKACSSAIRSFL